MNFADLQPYLTAVSAAFSVVTMGFLVNLVKAVRDNAQDRIAVQEERLRKAAEDQQRMESWAKREKEELRQKLDDAKAQMDALLKKEGFDLTALALGKKISDSTDEVRTTAEALVREMKSKLTQLANIEAGKSKADREWELSVAMGAMAAGAFSDAAAYFDAYAKDGGSSWQAHFSRGVAHANTRGGRSSDFASLRAYNDAIAFAPMTIDPNKRARLFTYRGAILKRLGRLDEAEADLTIARPLAIQRKEKLDIHYNLACIYAMRSDRDPMLREVNELRGSKEYIGAVAAHLTDYFSRFANDSELLAAIGR